MIEWIQPFWIVLFLLSCASVIYHIIRYRTAKDPIQRGIYQARNNISMGLMLILFAFAQNFFVTESLFRRIFGIISFLIGFYNLFAGIRNFLVWKRKKTTTGP